MEVVVEDKDFLDDTFSRLQAAIKATQTGDWSDFDDSVIQKFLELLLPEMQDSLFKELTKRAKQYVIEQSCEELRSLLMTPPYRKDGKVPIVGAMVIKEEQRGRKMIYTARVNPQGTLFHESKIMYTTQPFSDDAPSKYA